MHKTQRENTTRINANTASAATASASGVHDTNTKVNGNVKQTSDV